MLKIPKKYICKPIDLLIYKMPKACPRCKNHSWKVCPKCHGFICYSCRLDRDGNKMTSNNLCTYCNYTGVGWKADNKGPSWGK